MSQIESHALNMESLQCQESLGELLHVNHTLEQAARYSIGLTQSNRILLAVSGGSDSMAMLSAAQAISGVEWYVATVNHGLRAEALQEIEIVKRHAEKLTMPWVVLDWYGDKPITAVQEHARNARYRLLHDYARRMQIRTLFTAHTVDDQAETLLMRLVSGSRLKGLCGIAYGRSFAEDLYLVRPFINLGKKALVDYCISNHVAYANDSSNVDTRFARTRFRQYYALLASEGWSPERIQRFVQRCAEDEEALELWAGSLYDTLVHSEVDCIRLDVGPFIELPKSIQYRVLARVCLALGRYPQIRAHKLERLLAVRVIPCVKEQRWFQCTLGGLVFCYRGEDLVVSIENARRTKDAMNHNLVTTHNE